MGLPGPLHGEGGGRRASFAVEDYDLAATLDCGQAFRWVRSGSGWCGVIGRRWVRLWQEAPGVIEAEALGAGGDWGWLEDYLRIRDHYPSMLAGFPPDPELQVAVAACRGLRLLRQDPWECLASFILSSTKQITQIREIVARLCRGYGMALEVPPGEAPAWAFPGPDVLGALAEAELRRCGMGFRAPYLQASARKVRDGVVRLDALPAMPLAEARAALMGLPGVGRKIADCVLLFSCGHDEAFPVDVWVLRALRRIYFPRRDPGRARLLRFTETHFGPCAGLAQQVLFHQSRTRRSKPSVPP
jgi:N-glycosylase/DNA lyase